jgi:hypothetical protein
MRQTVIGVIGKAPRGARFRPPQQDDPPRIDLPGACSGAVLESRGFRVARRPAPIAAFRFTLPDRGGIA